MTKSNRGFSSNQGDIPLLKSNNPIWPIFKLDQDFIHVHLICKFQEQPIKTEWLMQMTKSNRGFFSNHGDIPLGIMIWSSQFSNLSETSSMSTLSANFWNIQSKLNELCWWQSQTEAFLAIKVTYLYQRVIIRSGPFSNLAKISSMSTLSASFRNILSKLKELWWWQIYSHCVYGALWLP